MINIEVVKKLNPYIEGYCKIVIEGAHERLSCLSETKENLVIGAHIARMATLSAHLMACPVGWSHHMAVLSFRAQVECLITLGWILKDINENSKRYITDSIKGSKKSSEKYDVYLSDLVRENPELESEYIFKKYRKEAKKLENEKKKWRQSQQAKWGGNKCMPPVDARAKILGPLLESTYIDMYSWLCEHSHNSWRSLYHCNTKEIPNSTLRIPTIGDGFDMDIMEKSVRYLSLVYQMIDDKYNLDIVATPPIEYWEKHKRKIKRILGI